MTFHWIGIEMVGEREWAKSLHVKIVLYWQRGTSCHRLPVTILERFRPLAHQNSIHEDTLIYKKLIIFLFLTWEGRRGEDRGGESERARDREREAERQRDHGRLPNLLLRPMVRVCGRDEQNLIYLISSSSRALSTKSLNGPSMKWNWSLLKMKHIQTKTKPGLE